LWSAADHFSFDIVRRIEAFHTFENDEQFTRVADELARRAVEAVHALRSRFIGFSAVVREFFWSHSGWPAYHKAIALGLSSSGWSRWWSSWYLSILIANAKRDSPRWMHDRSELCARLRAVLGEPTEFRGQVVHIINVHRTAIGLETKPNPLTDRRSTRALCHV
jgi:GAF domain-containing protein